MHDSTILRVVSDDGTVVIEQGSRGLTGAIGPKGDRGGFYQVYTVNGVLAVGSGVQRFYLPDNATITRVRASVGEASVGANIVVDVNKNGTTLFTTQSNRPTILTGQYTDTSIPDVTSVVSGDYLTIDIDQVGSTTPGSNLTVQVEFN